MASSAKFISSLLFISLLAMQIHGRESQFFSKFSSNTNNEQKVPENEVTPTTADPVSTNEQEYQPEQREQQEPVFLPEKQNTGSGLYGHETSSGELPSTTTPTNLPYNSDSEEYNSYPNTQNKNYYYNRDSFDGGNQNEFGSSKFSQIGFNNRKTYSTAGNNNYYSQQRQGMSDTRFLENGKYFYDVNSEKLNSNYNQYENTKNGVPTSWNWNNNAGYYGQNKQNSYEYRNSMGGYQNNQEEYQNEENDFEEP